MPRPSKLKPGPVRLPNNEPNLEPGVWCNCGRLVYRRRVQSHGRAVTTSFNRNGTRHHCPPDWTPTPAPTPAPSQLEQLRAAQATPVRDRTIAQSALIFRAYAEGLIPHCGDYRIDRAAPD